MVFGVWEDGDFYADEPQHMTHESLSAYVGQLPRPLNYYVEGGNAMNTRALAPPPRPGSLARSVEARPRHRRTRAGVFAMSPPSPATLCEREPVRRLRLGGVRVSRPDAVGQALWLERIRTAQADVEHAQQHLQEVAVAAIADGLPRLVICRKPGSPGRR